MEIQMDLELKTE